MTKAKLARIKRKLERAAQLTREAHELVGSEPVGRSVAEVRDVTSAAVDAGAAWLRAWNLMEARWRQSAEGVARHLRAVEEFGRCTRCDTGAAADHVHCRQCGWAIAELGPGKDMCQNRRCPLFEQDQPGGGVRYSDRRAPGPMAVDLAVVGR